VQESTPYGTEIFNGSLDKVTHAWRGRKSTGGISQKKPKNIKRRRKKKLETGGMAG
jgi:hypothetical protein